VTCACVTNAKNNVTAVKSTFLLISIVVNRLLFSGK